MACNLGRSSVDAPITHGACHRRTPPCITREAGPHRRTGLTTIAIAMLALGLGCIAINPRWDGPVGDSVADDDATTGDATTGDRGAQSGSDGTHGGSGESEGGNSSSGGEGGNSSSGEGGNSSSGDGGNSSSGEPPDMPGPTCPGPQMRCDGECHDVRSDKRACGADCVDCTALFGNDARCEDGQCDDDDDDD